MKTPDLTPDPQDIEHPLLSSIRPDPDTDQAWHGVIATLEAFGFEVNPQVHCVFGDFGTDDEDVYTARRTSLRVRHRLAEGYTRVLTFENEDGDDVIWDVKPTTALARVILRCVENEAEARKAEAAPELLLSLIHI